MSLLDDDLETNADFTVLSDKILKYVRKHCIHLCNPSFECNVIFDDSIIDYVESPQSWWLYYSVDSISQIYNIYMRHTRCMINSNLYTVVNKNYSPISLKYILYEPIR